MSREEPKKDHLRVIPHERGVVRVFCAAERAPGWADTGSADWSLPGALGVDALNSDDVQVFDTRELASMTLSEFLAQGYDVSPGESEAEALDSAAGTIAILRSGAFRDTPLTLTPAPGVTLVGRFRELGASGTAGRIGDFESARPRPAAAGAPPSDTDLPEDDGAPVIEAFRPSREAYIRSHLWLGAAAMGLATAVLYWLGNADYWVGAVAGLLAIAVRGFYLASEELGRRWELTETSVRAVSETGAIQRVVPLREVAKVRRLGSAVQIVTRSGDKMLMKYIGDPGGVQQRVAGAAGVPLT